MFVFERINIFIDKNCLLIPICLFKKPKESAKGTSPGGHVNIMLF